MADLKLLIHVPDSKRFEPVLKITKNSVLAMEEGKNFKIRIFANFEGITVLNDFTRFEALFQRSS